MTKVQDEWRLAIEETAAYARRYRWLRTNPLPFFNEMSPEELDAEIDTRSGVVPAGTMETGAEGLI